MPTLFDRLVPVALLVASNVFMTFAWYGHLKFKTSPIWIVIFAMIVFRKMGKRPCRPQLRLPRP